MYWEFVWNSERLLFAIQKEKPRQRSTPYISFTSLVIYRLSPASIMGKSLTISGETLKGAFTHSPPPKLI